MKKLILFLTVSFSFFIFCGCERNPAGALMYNGVNDSDPSTWGDPFILYRNGDIMTRVQPFEKAIGAYTNIWEKYGHLGNELEAQYNGVSHSGYKSFKMSWSGDHSETYSGVLANNVNFWLNATASGDPRDLSAAGYKKISFWIKTSLKYNTELVINVFGHSYPEKDIVIKDSSGWTYREVDISAYDHTSVKTYISVAMQPETGSSCGGGTIYLDDIRLTK